MSVSVFSVCLLISVRCVHARATINVCASSQVSALMKLVRKAAASKQFQSELVDLSRNTFRSTVPGEIAS